MTVSIINISPTDEIKPRLVVDFMGDLKDDADSSFSLRRSSDNLFWNFVDQKWNLGSEIPDAKKVMIPIGGGEYDSPAIPMTILDVGIGELITAKFFTIWGSYEDIGVDFYKVKVVGTPTMKFPQTQTY